MLVNLSRKQYRHGDTVHDLVVVSKGPDHYKISSENESCAIELLSMSECSGTVSIDGARRTIYFFQPRNGFLYLSMSGCSREYCDQICLDGFEDTNLGSGRVLAPMHGLLLEIYVAEGDLVKKGQKLGILEAMKMHYEITAEVDGSLGSVNVKVGEQVAADDLLMEIEAEG